MSQHDYDLANQAGAAFRSDINAALAAIVSQNSGAAEPATMFAYQFWADTTTGILKQRNAANNAWIPVVTLATGVAVAANPLNALLAGNAAQQFSALAVNTAMTTVASSGTPDIFAAATGQVINYTGTATATGFAAAPFAGMRRTLICAEDCSFYSGSSLKIAGVSSGTVYMPAGTVIEVIAVSTTLFRLTYSFSGSVQVSATGFAVAPTAFADYSVTNGVVSLNIPSKIIQGTSNATTFTITGIPLCLRPITTAIEHHIAIVEAWNNTASVYADVRHMGSYLLLGNGHDSGAWVASGLKGLVTSTFSYPIRGSQS